MSTTEHTDPPAATADTVTGTAADTVTGTAAGNGTAADTTSEHLEIKRTETDEAVHQAAEHYAGNKEESHQHKSFFSGAYDLISGLFETHRSQGSFTPILDMESYHRELYLIGGDSDHKTYVSTDVICGAAAYEAVQAYERHKKSRSLVGRHDLSKKFISGYAMAEAIKLFEAHHNRHITAEEKQEISARTAAHAQYIYEEVYVINGSSVELKNTRRY